MKGPRLRGRILGAFVLVAVPPLLVFSVAVAALFSRRFEQTARERLEAGIRAAQERVAGLRRRAETQVEAVVDEDLPSVRPAPEAERSVADEIARRRELPALEIVDAGGRVISSHHWPAGFGLEEKDGLFPGEPALRIEKVAQGYGVAERLAVLAERPAVWRGAPVTVRGGYFLDREVLDDLSRLMGVEVALYDAVRGAWIGPQSSPLRAWTTPALAAKAGTVRLEGEEWRWAAAPLHPQLSLLVATPASALDLVLADVRRLTLLLAGLVLLAALLGAVVLSGRLALPIRELAQRARRVSGGDLEGSVPVRTDDEIGDLARAFNAMTAELRASRERLVQVERVAAWREMARRLAHELKKPLFPIQLSIETLRRWLEREPGSAPSPPPDPEFRRLFRDSTDTVLQELRALGAIVEEFGEFARLPRPRLRPTDLERVVDQVLALYQARLAGTRLERAADPAPIVVNADTDLLARALGNLVANALEAMREGGTLRVRTTRRGGAAVVEVDDSGPGLDAEARNRLFTPYYTTKPGGTGLGLAVAQGIVTDHGGRIQVESEPGRGACFSIVLPLEGSEPAS